MTATPEAISADFWATFDQELTAAQIEYGSRKTDREIYLAIYGRTLGGGVRRRPNRQTTNAIRERQGNRCLYCLEPIGALILRRNQPVELRAAWDHFIPYQYAAANRATNWALACHLCNRIKYNKIFETLAEAQRHINARWHQLRLERLSPDLQRRMRMAG